MKKQVKAKEHEKLTPQNIERVIQLLEAQQPITKKAACEALNIAYNTTRLSKIIEDYRERKAYDSSRREKNRGQPAQSHEITSIVESYLGGDTISDISKRLYRSPTFVINTIDRIGLPTRPVGDLKYEKSILPDKCISDSFEKGETAWSAKYHATCKILQEITPEYAAKNPGLNVRDYLKEDGSRCYSVYINESIDEDISGRFASVSRGGRYAYAFAYDLGKLDHLKEYGIDKFGA